mmetsp:Transcript_20889/g.52904  ORF Transcript_20889/g.52904 Transcript_20889/m.52904 type:complete len:323 (-) Transcript_20889:295-1263(-)
MGIMTLYRMTNVKKMNTRSTQSSRPSMSRYQWSTPNTLVQMRLRIPEMAVMDSTNRKMPKMASFMIFSREERLKGVCVAFCISLVSWPEYTTTPITQSVFLMVLPRHTQLRTSSGNLVVDPGTVMRPEKLYSLLLGPSHSTTPSKLFSSLSVLNPSVSFRAVRTFKLVSPSIARVSMKHAPFSSEVLMTAMSAGTASFFVNFTMSPALTSIHFCSMNTPCLSTVTGERLTEMSLFQRRMSSYASLTAVTHSTKARGITLAHGEMGATPGMRLMRVTMRNQKLARRLNCSNKFLGRKVRGVYLVVEIELSKYLNTLFRAALFT